MPFPIVTLPLPGEGCFEGLAGVLRLRCGDSILASAIGVSVPCERPHEMRRSLGRALVPNVNLARVNFEGAHVVRPIAVASLRRFDLMTLHEAIWLVKHFNAKLQK